jgi:hypothetical protein
MRKYRRANPLIRGVTHPPGNDFSHNYPQLPPQEQEQDAAMSAILSESYSDSSLFQPDKAAVWPRVNSP